MLTFMASDAECEAVFAQVSHSGEVSVAEVLAAMPIPRRPYVERTLLWLMKFDILRLTSATPLTPLTGDQPGGPEV